MEHPYDDNSVGVFERPEAIQQEIESFLKEHSELSSKQIKHVLEMVVDYGFAWADYAAD